MEAKTIGTIVHDGVTVKVAGYNGDWEDHVIHIWESVFSLDGAVAPGFYGVDGSLIERPSIMLTRSEALGLIQLLAEAAATS